jgi:hypothetical protein
MAACFFGSLLDRWDLLDIDTFSLSDQVDIRPAVSGGLGLSRMTACTRGCRIATHLPVTITGRDKDRYQNDARPRMLDVEVGQPATPLHPETAEAVARVIFVAVVGGLDAEQPGEHERQGTIFTW